MLLRYISSALADSISSTYPSLLLLKYSKASGISNGPLQSKANRYLNLGYHRLLNYREPGGGFSYWGHGSADTALTAYAIRFLLDAASFIEVDPEVIQDAGKWLVAQQNKDGGWQPRYGYDDAGLSAHVTSTLAELEQQVPDPEKKSVHDSATRALTYLADPHRDLSDPYALAEFALAARLKGLIIALSFPAIGSRLSDTPYSEGIAASIGTQRRMLWHTRTGSESFWVVC